MRTFSNRRTVKRIPVEYLGTPDLYKQRKQHRKDRIGHWAFKIVIWSLMAFALLAAAKHHYEAEKVTIHTAPLHKHVRIFT